MSEKRFQNSYNARALALTALLCAVSIALSFLESLIPDFPFVMPGMKLGLSNIVVMFALELLPLPSSLAVVIFKAVFALITRGFTAFLMSLSGGFFSVSVMFLLIRSRKTSFGALGIGVAGAFMHNMGQLLVAYIIVSDGIYAYIPILSGASILTGTLTGLANYIILPVIKKIPIYTVKENY